MSEVITETYVGKLAGQPHRTELIINRQGDSLVQYILGERGTPRPLGAPIRNATDEQIDQLRQLARGYVL